MVPSLWSLSPWQSTRDSLWCSMNETIMSDVTILPLFRPHSSVAWETAPKHDPTAWEEVIFIFALAHSYQPKVEELCQIRFVADMEYTISRLSFPAISTLLVHWQSRFTPFEENITLGFRSIRGKPAITTLSCNHDLYRLHYKGHDVNIWQFWLV